MFDDTTDISHISQMTLVFRYVSNGGIREDFVRFADCQKEISQIDLKSANDLLRDTLKILGKKTRNVMKNFQLYLKKLVV